MEYEDAHDELGPDSMYKSYLMILQSLDFPILFLCENIILDKSIIL